MKVTAKIIDKLIIIGTIAAVAVGCQSSCQPVHEYGFEAPVKTIIFDLPFPHDFIYQAAPDAKIIVGKKDARPPLDQANGIDAPYYEIARFEIETGNKLWQLPFTGEIVGETATQILVYEAKTSVLHFVNPSNGLVTSQVSPAPNPLLSKNSLDFGVGFTDDVYLTTKALYTSIYKNAADWENRQDDDSFQIGITAKSWKDEKVKWFVPPVKQIVTIENRPVIFDDKVFIINPPQMIDGDQTYQIVSLKTGAEIFRGATKGKFSNIGKNLFIEQTDTFVRRFEPLSGAEIWKIEGNFHHAHISAIGGQITVAVANQSGVRAVTLVDAPTGKTIIQFEISISVNTPLNGCFLTADKQILCNFAAESHTDILHRDFNYWTAYDATAKKVLWRTAMNSHSASSLFTFMSDKVRFK